MSRSAIWKFHPGGSKVNVMGTRQVFTGRPSCLLRIFAENQAAAAKYALDIQPI